MNPGPSVVPKSVWEAELAIHGCFMSIELELSRVQMGHGRLLGLSEVGPGAPISIMGLALTLPVLGGAGWPLSPAPLGQPLGFTLG